MSYGKIDERHGRGGRKGDLLRALLVLFWATAWLGLGRVAVHAAPQHLEDTEIAAAVERQLQLDEQVPAHLVDVAVREGVVTLSGQADNLWARDQATRVAESILGVRSVINDIEVRPTERADELIQNDVVEALALDPATEAYEVEVTAQNGVVNLAGRVDSWAEKQLVARVAKSVPGVRSVENRITFDPGTDRRDDEIAAEIRQRLRYDPYLDECMLNVNVEGGRVTLSGAVGSAAELSRVKSKCWVAGVRAVVYEDVEVKWWLRDQMRRRSPGVRIDDEQVAATIRLAWQYDPRVDDAHLAVTVTDGKATLSGKVGSLAARQAARADAHNTVGVRSVANRIKVRPPQIPSDDALRQEVLDALIRNVVLDRFDFTVAVHNQKVYLYGRVETDYQKRHAETVVAGVPGVVDVANEVEVAHGWHWKPDREIAEDVRSELFWSVFVDSDDLNVEVHDGEVTLSGKVSSWHEYLSAIENAFEGGAERVDAQITIAEPSGERARQRYYYPYPYPYYPVPGSYFP